MTSHRLEVGILALAVVACGGDGGAPPPPGSPDTEGPSDVGQDSGPLDAVRVDAAAQDVSQSADGREGPNDVALPPLAEWLLLNPVEGFGTVAVQPAVAWDAEGRVAVLWTGRQGDGSGIVGGLWAPGVPHVEVVAPAFLTEATSGLRNDPRLCTGSGARAFLAAWSADLRDGSEDNLAIFTRFVEAPFSPLGSGERRLLTGPGRSHWLASLACAQAEGSGAVVAAVRGGASAGFEVFVQRLDREGEPLGDAVVPRSSDGGGQLFPSVAMSPSGDVFVAFEESPGGESPSSVFLAHVDALGVVSVTPLDDVLPPPAAGATLVATDDGVLVAAGTPVGLRFVWRDAAGALNAIANPDGGTASTGAAAMTDLGEGRLGVVWLRAAANSQQDVRFSVFNGEAFVGEPLTLATGRYPVAYRPSIAARDGRLAVAFTESLGAGAFTVRVALARVPGHEEVP